MKPVEFEGSNITLNPPSVETVSDCKPMRAYYGEMQDGTIGFVSAWIPSPEDLAALNRGEVLYLRVLSNTFAPVALYTANEEGQINPE